MLYYPVNQHKWNPPPAKPASSILNPGWDSMNSSTKSACPDRHIVFERFQACEGFYILYLDARRLHEYHMNALRQLPWKKRQSSRPGLKEKEMKVGFAVQLNEGMESAVYDHFGSAPAFIIVDTDLKQVSAVDNTNVHHAHGACNPIMALGGNRIDAMVVGGIGPGAIVKLNAMGVRVFRAGAATVGENLALLGDNRLQEISMNDSCRRHGGQCGH
jgi:predicted Fe-Mo cluster-binding NifX family protein